MPRMSPTPRYSGPSGVIAKLRGVFPTTSPPVAGSTNAGQVSAGRSMVGPIGSPSIPTSVARGLDGARGLVRSTRQNHSVPGTCRVRRRSPRSSVDSVPSDRMTRVRPAELATTQSGPITSGMPSREMRSAPKSVRVPAARSTSTSTPPSSTPTSRTGTPARRSSTPIGSTVSSAAASVVGVVAGPASALPGSTGSVDSSNTAPSISSPTIGSVAKGGAVTVVGGRSPADGSSVADSGPLVVRPSIQPSARADTATRAATVTSRERSERPSSGWSRAGSGAAGPASRRHRPPSERGSCATSSTSIGSGASPSTTPSDHTPRPHDPRPASPRRASGTVPSMDVRATVEGYLAALSAADVDRVLDHVTDDFHNEHTSSIGSSSYGRDEYRSRLPGFLGPVRRAPVRGRRHDRRGRSGVGALPAHRQLRRPSARHPGCDAVRGARRPRGQAHRRVGQHDVPPPDGLDRRGLSSASPRPSHRVSSAPYEQGSSPDRWAERVDASTDPRT
jgi:hypothetical protein